MQSTAYADRELLVGRLKLHYQEWGDASAPPMILLHGFGVSGHMFDEFGMALEGRYHLFCIDQRGHGDSEWSSDGDYSRDAFVADLEGFRSALGLDKFILVGHSMGGLNAVTYATRFPGRVERLILIDVGPEAVREGVDNIIRFTRGPDNLEFEQYVEMAHQFNPRRSIENIRERMRHRLRPSDEGKWTWKFDSRFRDPSSGIVIGSTLSTEDTWALFRAVTTPTLLVRGGESDVLSQEVAEKVVGEMEQARLVVVPGAGHSVPGDSPDSFTEAVLAFLAEPIPANAAPTEGAVARLEDQEAPAEAPAPEASVPEHGDNGAGLSKAHEALRAELAASEAPPLPAGRPRRRRGSLIVFVGSVALAAAALVLGVRAVSRRRKRATSGRLRRKRRLRSDAQQEAMRARRRAIALFDELSAVGRERLQQARVAEARAEAVGRMLTESLAEPTLTAAERRTRGSRRRGREVLRLAGRSALNAGTLAVDEGRGALRRRRRRKGR